MGKEISRKKTATLTLYSDCQKSRKMGERIMDKKKLGLPSVIAAGTGLIVATSCLMSLGQGAGAIGVSFIIAMLIACIINIFTALSMAELNALMPNLTGGLAQYTLACMGPFVAIITMVGGYLVCNAIAGSVECAMFGNTITSVFDTKIPSNGFCIILLVILIIANLNGIDMFAKIQNFVAYGLIISLVAMGVIGILGIGTGEKVSQPWVLTTSCSSIFPMVGLAFFLFLGCEFIIPIAKYVNNPRKNVPLGMVLSLVVVCVMQMIVVLGMHNYTEWKTLANSNSPHIFYGTSLLGRIGALWMILVSIFAVISTVNSVLSSLSYICAGMAKINLLPAVFQKRNKKGAPYVGIFMIGGFMIIVNATGLSSSDQLSFMILVGCVFWMIAYIVSNLNVLILRKRMPKAPRNFKVPLGPVFPTIGILGNVFMIWNIAGDQATRLRIYAIDGAIFLVMAIYTVIWVKKVMKRKLFTPVPIHEVMAMENNLYMITHGRVKEVRK
ncbi:MAG TPA: amino acid permease [Lachnospiraceae bacterium]|nr:amino acid permease [Lachnospiraceae bacterium]